jgi:hypothetical protein
MSSAHIGASDMQKSWFVRALSSLRLQLFEARSPSWSLISGCRYWGHWQSETSVFRPGRSSRAVR